MRVLNDYINIKHTFYNIKSFDILYQTDKKDEPILVKFDSFDNNKKNENDSKENFKIEWIDEEIELFNEYLSEILKSNNNNYDSLIYFIIAKGNNENCIYDSNMEEISLEFTFDLFYNQNCKKLRRKPKIYFIDGPRTSNINKNDYKYQNIINCNQLESNISGISNIASSNTATTMNVDSIDSSIDKKDEFDEFDSNIDNGINNIDPIIDARYLGETQCYKIYSNVSGFDNINYSDIIDNNNKLINSSIMIKSICEVMNDNNKDDNDFNKILFEMKLIMNEKINKYNVNNIQLIQEYDTMDGKICFKTK